MNKKYFLCAATLALIGGYAQADPIAQADSVRVIDEVLVTATQTPRSIKKLPIITQVLTKQDIVRINPRSPLDVLEMSIPGLQTSLHGAQVRLRVQGLSSAYLLILVDGERISSEGEGIVDLNRIDMNLVERVEIIRGSASAIYGSNAIGGVVNFITRRAAQSAEVSALAEYGSEGMQRYAASVGANADGFRALLAINRHIQDEYVITNNDVTGAKMPSNKTWNIAQKFQYTSPNQHWDARLTGTYTRRDQSSDSQKAYVYDVYTANAQLAHLFNQRHSVNLSHNFERYNRSTLFLTPPNDHVKQALYYLDTHQARAQYNFGQEDYDALHLNIGMEYLHESLEGERLLAFGTRYKANTISFYGQADWAVLSKLTLSAGIREDIHSQFKGNLTPRLSVLYTASNNCRLRLNYAEGFRSPTLKNMYMYWDHLGMFDIVGSTDLKPEHSRMISFAPEYYTKNFSLTLIASYNNVRDKIDLKSQIDGSRLKQVYSNLDEETTIWTVQSNLRWQIFKGLRLNFDYAWVHNPYEVTTTSGQRVPGTSVRPHNFTTALSYECMPLKTLALSANAAYRYTSGLTSAVEDIRTGVISTEELEPYGLLRLGLSALYKKSYKLTIGIDNALNYEPKNVNFTGSFSPGRTWFASLGYTL